MFFPSKKRNRVRAFELAMGTHPSIVVPVGSRYLDALVVTGKDIGSSYAGGSSYLADSIMVYVQASDAGEQVTWRFRLLGIDEMFEDCDEYGTHLKALSLTSFGQSQVYQLYRQSWPDDPR